MNKKFWLIAGALVILSLISAGIGNARTVTITPRDTQTVSDVSVIIPAETTSPPKPSPSADTSAEDSGAVTYVINTNTKKFHLPDCASVTQMKEKNRLPFTGTRDEAITKGYSPCQNCNP